METLKEQYINALKKINNEGIIINTRGFECKEILAFTFIIDPNDNILKIPGFETNLKYAQKELEWYYSGSNHINFDPIIKKAWERYSDDGEHVNSAYGYRIFGKHPNFVDQWEWIKNKLKEDINSRQCVININDVSDKRRPTKDFCCTMYCQVFIRDNKLHWITNMRSQDIYYGTRNDIYCFCEMQKRLAKELNLELGNYYHFCGSLHIYKQQYEKINNLI